MMRARVTALMALMASVANAGDLPPIYNGTYFCKTFASGGVRYDETTKQWVSATFDVGDDALTVRVRDTGKAGKDQFGFGYRIYSITVKKFGSEGEPHVCSGRKGENVGYGETSTTGSQFSCSFIGTDYEIDVETKRLQIVFHGGYMWEEPDRPNHDTPYVAVAKCDKVD